MNSNLWTLNLNDFWKGLILAVLSTPLTIIVNSLQAGQFNIDWQNIGIVALTCGLTYLSKNLGTGSGGQILTNAYPPLILPESWPKIKDEPQPPVENAGSSSKL